MSRLSWLQNRQTALEKLSQDWANSKETHLKGILNKSDTGEWFMVHRRDRISVEQLEATITSNLSELGIKIDLSLHKEFDANHMVPAPSDSTIQSDFDREEYRKYYNQYQTSEQVLTDALQAVNAQIVSAQSEILNFGRTHKIK